LPDSSGKGERVIEEKIKVIFVHGWGMNRLIWQSLVDDLPDWIDPVCIDLPGHGEAGHLSFSTVDDLVNAMEQKINEPAIWIGWSLGGLAVMQLALQHPEKVNAMLLVASTPSFVHKESWACGMESKVFDIFADELGKDFSGTIRRFLSLQVRGSDSGRQVLKSLREKVLAQPPANIEALRAGLNILKTTDLRNQLKNITIPVSWVLGERDTLIKSTLSKELESILPAAKVSVYEQAAHAPFLSHQQKFSEQLISFIKEVS
jgi:pimeloyl-[acyl-carrier protein] methyl ester esterase